MITILGDRIVALGRELTKIHEELVIRPISGHLGAIVAGKGEYTLVVQPAADPEPPDVKSLDDAIVTEFGHLTDTEGQPRRAAIKQLAKKYGRGAREVYALIEASRDSGE